jgi:hypothetical protein
MNIFIMIIVVACTGLFVLVFLQWKMGPNSEHKLFKMFEKLVKENKLLIHYKDVLNKRLIGYDKQNKKLLLLNLNKKDRLAACISLDEIALCSKVFLKDESSKFHKKAFLELVLKENNDPLIFCFYDESYEDTREKACLFLKARHWNQRINFHKQYWWMNSEEFVL